MTKPAMQKILSINNHHGCQNAPVVISIKSVIANTMNNNDPRRKIFLYFCGICFFVIRKKIPQKIQKTPSRKLKVSKLRCVKIKNDASRIMQKNKITIKKYFFPITTLIK
jgi:hypothetical protein